MLCVILCFIIYPGPLTTASTTWSTGRAPDTTPDLLATFPASSTMNTTVQFLTPAETVVSNVTEVNTIQPTTPEETRASNVIDAVTVYSIPPAESDALNSSNASTYNHDSTNDPPKMSAAIDAPERTIPSGTVKLVEAGTSPTGNTVTVTV